MRSSQFLVCAILITYLSGGPGWAGGAKTVENLGNKGK